MHPAVWNPPSPLWASVLQDDRARFERPEILRFAADDFMDRFRETLTSNPDGLGDHVVRPETWRTASDWDETEVPGLSDGVKLYQPSHQRFYLVTASLVCRTQGLPDRRVRPAQQERAAFVLRRVVPHPNRTLDVTEPDTFAEFGWCGPEDGWQPVRDIEAAQNERKRQQARGESPSAGGLVEEELPLFPVSFSVERALDTPRGDGPSNGTRRTARPPQSQRTLWAGLLPVARRDEYETVPGGAPVTDDDVSDDAFSADPRRTQAEATVLQALAMLRGSATKADASPDAAEGVRDGFVYALLDLVQFARQHLPDLDRAIAEGSWQRGASEQERVWNALGASMPAGPLRSAFGTTWQAALQAVHDAAEPVQPGLDLLGLDDLDALLTLDAGERSDVVTSINNLNANAFRPRLRAAIDALPDDSGARPPDAPAPVQRLDGSRYVVRCVYDRPRCAPYETRAESAPSRVFRMASFFDPEAPARPLTINLPVDTSVGTLRNTAKGVSFLFSKQLRQQVQRVQDVTFGDLDEGEVGDGGGVSIGMICSLSIPIITICALILLLVMVFVLNIVFWWLPYFKICFPIPTVSSD